MLQSKAYEFMVKFTPQKEWIEGHGIMVAFALFFGGLAGGLYLTALYFDNMLGMFIAWLFAMATGLTDMAHLSKPTRAWRMIRQFRTSWITRGFLIIAAFIGSAAIQLALSQWAPGTAAETVFKVIAGIFAFGVAIYSGFLIGYVGAIKLWNTAMLPLLFVIAGLTGGMAVMLLVGLGETVADQVRINQVALGAFVVYAIFVATYIWMSSYESNNAKDSVQRLLTGNVSRVFWLLVVVIGIVVPIALLIPFVLNDTASSAAAIIAGICGIAGGIGLRYTILKAGVYSPLLPTE